jgi:hypothetical protein
MDAGGGSGVGKFLVFCCILGAIAGYWFYVASQFATGNTINLAQKSFLPVSCNIGSDRAADTRQTAQVYFWQGSVRIDLKSQGEVKLVAHQIIKPTGASYVWRDDSGYGEVSTVAKRSHILSGIAKENSWFCMPWFIPDFNLFNIPGNVTFE